MSDDLARMAKGLTKAQREAVMTLEGWSPGPQLSQPVLAQLFGLRHAGFVERQFGDLTDTSAANRDGSVTFNMRACWFFCLTPLGLSLRRYLKEQADEQ